MNRKTLSLILIVISSFASLYFVIKQNIEMAVLFLTILFTLTNYSRYQSFKQQGMKKESKWMLNMAIFFAIATLAVLYTIIT